MTIKYLLRSAAVVVVAGLLGATATPATAATLPQSSIIAAADIKSPSNVRATSSATRITVAWDKRSGATNYKVRIKDPSGGTIASKTVDKNTLSHKFYGLKPKTKYQVSVASINAKGQGSYSSGVYKTTKELAKPERVGTPSVSSIKDASVVVTWSAKADVETYQINVLKAGKVVKSVEQKAVKNHNSLYDTKVTVAGLPQYSDLEVRVRGVNAKGKGDWSPHRAFKTLATKIDSKNVGTPKVDAITATSANVSWNAVPYAHNYVVTVKQGNKTAKTYTTTGTTQKVTGLTAGTAYSVTYTAKNTTSSATSAARNFVTVPSKVTGVKATSNGGKIIVTWKPVAGAQSYLVTVTDAVGAKLSSSSSTTTSKTLSNLPEGVDLFVTVAAVNASGAGATSDKAKVTLPPASPSGVRVQDITLDSAVISWNAPSVSVLKYIVVVTDEGENPGKVLFRAEVDGTATSVTATKLAWGSKHKASVTAVGEGGESVPAAARFETKKPTRLSGTMKAKTVRTGKSKVRTTLTISLPGKYEGSDTRPVVVNFDPDGSERQTGKTVSKSVTLKYNAKKKAYVGKVEFSTKAHGRVWASGKHVSIAGLTTTKIRSTLDVAKFKKTSKVVSAKIKVKNGKGTTVRVQKKDGTKWKTVARFKVTKNNQKFSLKKSVKKHRNAKDWRVVLPTNVTAYGMTKTFYLK